MPAAIAIVITINTEMDVHKNIQIPTSNLNNFLY